MSSEWFSARDAKAWKNMRAAYVVSTEFAEFDGPPAKKKFREVSDEDAMSTQQGPPVRPLPPTHCISNLTLMQPFLLNSLQLARPRA
jgi:hypothetical protein